MSEDATLKHAIEKAEGEHPNLKLAVLIPLGRQTIKDPKDAITPTSKSELKKHGGALLEGGLAIERAFFPQCNRGAETVSALLGGNLNGHPVALETNANLNDGADAFDVSRCIRTRMRSSTGPVMFVSDDDLLLGAILNLCEKPTDSSGSPDVTGMVILGFNAENDVAAVIYA